MTMVMSLDEKQSNRTGVHEYEAENSLCFCSYTFGQTMCVCVLNGWLYGKRLRSAMLSVWHFAIAIDCLEIILDAVRNFERTPTI